MTKSKELVFYSWKPLSPEASRFSPYKHAQPHMRTSRTFYTFAVPRPSYITPSVHSNNDWRIKDTTGTTDFDEIIATNPDIDWLTFITENNLF